MNEDWERGRADYAQGRCENAGKFFFELDSAGKQYFLGWFYAKGRAALESDKQETETNATLDAETNAAGQPRR